MDRLENTTDLVLCYVAESILHFNGLSAVCLAHFSSCFCKCLTLTAIHPGNCFPAVVYMLRAVLFHADIGLGMFMLSNFCPINKTDWIQLILCNSAFRTWPNRPSMPFCFLCSRQWLVFLVFASFSLSQRSQFGKSAVMFILSLG